MKRLLLILAIILPVAVSCNKVKDITVTSVQLVSLSPHGMSELDAIVRVGIHNPTVGFEITNLSGLVKIKGQEALLMSSDQLMVSGHADKIYNIPVHGAICEGFNPFQLLNFLNSSTSVDDVTVDVQARVAMRGGIGKKLDYKDIRIGQYLKK